MIEFSDIELQGAKRKKMGKTISFSSEAHR